MFTKPTDGDISINGTSVNKKTTPQIVTLGVARTFQNIRLFKNLSVLDNVKLALNNSMSYSTLSAVLRLPKYWREERIATDTALDLLDIFDMAEMANIQLETYHMVNKENWKLREHLQLLQNCYCLMNQLRE